MPKLAHVQTSCFHFDSYFIFGNGFTESGIKIRVLDEETDIGTTNPISIVEYFAASGMKAVSPTGTWPQMAVNRTKVIDDNMICSVWEESSSTPRHVKTLTIESVAGSSNFVTVNSPQIFFLDKPQSLPGEMIRIVGRNLVSDHLQTTTPAHIYFTNRGGATVVNSGIVSFPEGDYHLDYREDAFYLLPFKTYDSMPSGSYDLYLYVGECGTKGCAGPISFDIKSTGVLPELNLSVSNYYGSNFTDANAIQAALLDAAASGSQFSHLYSAFNAKLDSTVYNLDRTVVIPSSVNLVGVSKTHTIIRPKPHHQFLRYASIPAGYSAPLDGVNWTNRFCLSTLNLDTAFYCMTDSRVADLTIDAQESSRLMSLIFFRHPETWGIPKNITVEDCSFSNYYWPVNDITNSQNTQSTCLTFNDSFRDHITIRRNDFIALQGINSLGGGAASACYVGYNYYKGLKNQFATGGFGRIPLGPYSIAEFNHISNYNRGITQNHTNAGIAYRFMLNKNTTEHGGYTTTGTECFLFEGSNATWAGQPSGYSLTTLSATGVNWTTDSLAGYSLLISSGTGYGGNRLITSNTNNTITLEKPLHVAPSSDSYAIVGNFYNQANFIGNYMNGSRGGIDLYDNFIDPVIHNNIFVESINGVWLAAKDTLDGATTLGNPISTFNPQISNCFFHNSQVKIGSQKRVDGKKIPLIIGVSINDTRFYDSNIAAMVDYRSNSGWHKYGDASAAASGGIVIHGINLSNCIFDSINDIWRLQTPFLEEFNRIITVPPIIRSYGVDKVILWKTTVGSGSSSTNLSGPTRALSIGFNLDDVQVI